ncbi:MAG TPA: NAD(P)H-binding protein [Nannocystaceae bacterium]|nr:NAD(P)H-binding protein [Nannocystaceae bacterium]
MINANGATGGFLTRELASRGAPVRALVRDRAKALDTLPAGTDVVAGDVTDIGSVRAALRGVEAVYLATPAHPELDAIEHAIAHACVDAGVARIVKLGGIRVVDDSAPPLMMKLHGRGQRAIRESGVPWVHLRASFFMQNFFMSAPEIAAGLVHAPTGNARASFVDARDIARCAAVVLTEPGHEGREYDITGPEALSFGDAARVLGRELGRDVAHVDVPTAGWVQAAVGAGAPAWVVARLGELYDHLRATEFAAAPTDAVRTITGRAPIDFATFVRDHRAAFG